MVLSLPEFIRRWKDSELTERAGSQSHFIDLCEILNEPHPAAADPTGHDYAFEKHVNKTGGDDKGFADVWKRGFFGWEYKGKHKDLKEAYRQLFNYSADLDNPPLLVVCDFEHFEVHSNFTNTPPLVYKFTLDDLMQPAPIPGSDLSALDILRAVFQEPEKLMPGALEVRVTERAAEEFTKLIPNLRKPGVDQEALARFVMRLLFCLFADSVGLLPDNAFRKMIEADRQEPRKFVRKLKNLFHAMAVGDDSFGLISIRHFNGGLFRADDDTVFDLTPEDMSILRDAAQLDWGRVEPAIFGTLFERILDEGKRAQLDAHYTSREDILLILEPVVMAPLRRRWEEVKAGAEEIAAAMETASSGTRAKLRVQLEDKVLGWMEELAHVRILDPACGSGNFLYMALWLLLDLWKEARVFAADCHLPTFLPCKVGPAQLYGIETNVYAHELASVVVWIGYLQWRKDNAMGEDEEPILKVLDNIQHRDAILELDAQGNPKLDSEGNPSEPAWPKADFIVSNPPFLGGKLLRRNLGDTYVDSLLKLYQDRVPAEADLVTYWFEKARAMVERKQARAVGLVATQGIRGGANREVLKRIAETGNIFMAWSDRNWINEGAAVHISIVGFDGGDEAERTLNGAVVDAINPDLTSGVDATRARLLAENAGLCFMGTTKVGAFDLDPETARKMLAAPLNPNGRPNSDVVRPWVNALDITRRPRGMYIIDFGVDMLEEEAALYEMPFEYLREHVYAERKSDNRDLGDKPRWLHGRPRPELRAALAKLNRYIITPRVSKHRLFAWLGTETVPDSATFAIARSDDYFFGVLHSCAHEVWARAQGTQLREVESGFRYTPTSTFETFPFPWPPGREPQDSPLVKAIAEAARKLVEERDRWLNPPGASPEELPKLTLTNLYNKPPKWLENAHRKLDEAVFAAYGWPEGLPDEELLGRLLALNQARA
ncbi:MAG: DNA methyltransferase [Terracidiphilus sp.]|jgi:type II restriction/modification system DNA methylase subunit YeeA